MLAVWGDKNKRNTPCTMLENMKCGTQWCVMLDSAFLLQIHVLEYL
jgi:hypothetical protein